MQTVQATKTLNDLLADYRRALDARDDARAVLKRAEDACSASEYAVRAAMESAGMTEDGAKVSAGGVTVTWREKLRAKYEPEKWDSIVRWATETGHTHIVQRRLTDKAVLELIDNGVALPDGLSVEPYPDLDFRRSS